MGIARFVRPLLPIREQIMHKSARVLHRLSSLLHARRLASAEFLADLGHLTGDTRIGVEFRGYLIIAMKDGGVVPAAQFAADLAQGAILFPAYQIDRYVSGNGSPLISLLTGQVVHRKTEMVGHHLQYCSDVLLAGCPC